MIITLKETSAKTGLLKERTEKYFRFIENTLVRADQEIGVSTFAEISERVASNDDLVQPLQG
ncbi:MAG TPA: hypothetical protein VN873_06860 [Candidatus Angelobacter sp.]|nr:hypothetical protein [Candidatus Angelobacter sp.]